MFLVVGLGNIGNEYERTYHNVGFLCVDELANKLNTKFSKRECKAVTASALTAKEKILLAKPLTFMNLSGFAVTALLNKYKLGLDKLIVIYDDIDLPVGTIRIRAQGSGGTHNGMRSIIEQTGSTEIIRIRIGIGQNSSLPLRDFVLSRIPDIDMTQIKQAIAKATAAIEMLCDGIPVEQANERAQKLIV